jgi:hypothetical protein
MPIKKGEMTNVSSNKMEFRKLPYAQKLMDENKLESLNYDPD